jgi:DNA-binding SARP family transcriptional activator
MITITLFGPTSVTTDAGTTLTASELGGIKPRQILEILAVSAGTPVAKERLADLVWEGRPPKTYVATLESYVCVLRRALGLAQGRRSVLATTSGGYVLDATQVRVDLVELRRVLAGAGASGTASIALETTEAALSTVTAPLLASEPYAAWAIRERELVEQELAAGRVRAARQALEVEAWERAVTLAAGVVERDPLAEVPARHLMKGLWRSGQRVEALRAYGRLRSAMVEELGSEPGSPTRELYLEILRDDAAGQGRGEQRSELRLILGLLRQTLESIPGIELPGSDSALAAVAVRVLDVA